MSHQHKFIFVKTRKTAGTSLEIALSAHCGPDDVITPISPEDEAIREELGYPGTQNINVPLSRDTSQQLIDATLRGSVAQLFNHLPAAQIRQAVGDEVWNGYFKFTVERDPFDKAVSRYWWSTRDTNPRPEIEGFLVGVPTEFLSDWNLYATGDEIAVDHVVRYEHLAQEIEFLSGHLGIDITLPSKRAKSKYRQDHRHYTESLPPLIRSRVERVCWREIAAFGYQWQPDAR